MQARFRKKRFANIEAMLRDVLRNKGEVLVLDAGGTAQYWNMLPEDLRPQVLITTLNFKSELDLYADVGFRCEG